MLGDAVHGLSAEERQTLGRAVDQVIERVNASRKLVGFGRCQDCTHLRQPEQAAKSCCCGITGDRLAAAELEQICIDFHR